MEKLISIIVPCYNVEKYIDRCFDSIAKQTIGLDKLLVIFIDDCSTDSTWKHLENIEKKHPDSVIIIHLDENGRQGRARNIGMQYVTTKYVTFLDSDDFVDSEMYEILYTPMLSGNYDLTMCGYWRDDGKIDYDIWPKHEGIGDRHFVIDTSDKRKTFICCMSMGTITCAKLYKTDFILENNIFYVEGYTYEDHMFMLLLYLYAKDILIIDNRCYHYYVNEQSTVMKPESAHHYDVITVDNMAWEECAKRGFLDVYRKELECYFLLISYLAPLKFISYRFERPPYDFYLKLREATLAKIPDYTINPYVKDYVTDFYKVILETLKLDISENEFIEICKAIHKKYGENL